MNKEDQLTGVLLGTAIGDALGLPYEGLPSSCVREGDPEAYNFSLFFGRGIVSDDTELSALLAQSILKSRGDDRLLVRHFRYALLGWFLRLPWGIGLGTLGSCFRILIGLKKTGSHEGSAGNGAAMRAAILGVYFNDDRERRTTVGRAVAEITHLDGRAVEGALFVAEVAALLSSEEFGKDPFKIIKEANRSVKNSPLWVAVDTARDLAERDRNLDEAVKILGNTGYVVHTVGLVTFCFLRYNGNVKNALLNIISAGGDTDTNAAILGAWFGAECGHGCLPTTLLNKLQGGPFGREHLKSLGMELAKPADQSSCPRYSWVYALVRNIMMFPIVILAGLRIVFYKRILRRK